MRHEWKRASSESLPDVHYKTYSDGAFLNAESMSLLKIPIQNPTSDANMKVAPKLSLKAALSSMADRKFIPFT